MYFTAVMPPFDLGMHNNFPAYVFIFCSRMEKSQWSLKLNSVHSLTFSIMTFSLLWSKCTHMGSIMPPVTFSIHEQNLNMHMQGNYCACPSQRGGRNNCEIQKSIALAESYFLQKRYHAALHYPENQSSHFSR